MTISVNPPPLNVPPEWAKDKIIGKFFAALINTLYQLWQTVYGLRVKFKVTTQDNTPTAVLRVPIQNGKTVMVVAYLAAQSDVNTSAWYRLMGAYKNVGGVLTGIGSPSLFGGEDTAGWDFYFTTSGEEIVLTVVGDSNKVTWEGMASTYVVGA